MTQRAFTIGISEYRNIILFPIYEPKIKDYFPENTGGTILGYQGFLNDLRCELASLRYDLAFAKFVDALRIKFNPDQPRDERGRWTDNAAAGNLSSAAASIASGATDFSSIGRGLSESECELRYKVDMLRCQAETRAPARAVCRSQAMERYAACRSGRPIPPLSF
jgi:hypothetical protein